jgi:hypothetical protein
MIFNMVLREHVIHLTGMIRITCGSYTEWEVFPLVYGVTGGHVKDV